MIDHGGTEQQIEKFAKGVRTKNSPV